MNRSVVAMRWMEGGMWLKKNTPRDPCDFMFLYPDCGDGHRNLYM